MHCFFMRAGHIADLSTSMTGLSDQDAITKAHLLFSERRAGFDGFKVRDRARMVIRHSDPSAEKPEGQLAAASSEDGGQPASDPGQSLPRAARRGPTGKHASATLTYPGIPQPRRVSSFRWLPPDRRLS